MTLTRTVVEEQSFESRRRVSRRGAIALLLMLLPAFLFPVGILLLRNDSRFTWIAHPSQYPWQLFAIALFGTVATVGGVGDWLFHRSGHTSVGAKEHRAHVLALGAGGGPLFLLMGAASIAHRPQIFLIPVLVVLIFTVVLICQDEFLFHRRCGRLEHALHRMLTFGNGLALLAWMHWCFVSGGANA